MADSQSQPRKSTVFISYSRKDKDLVRRLNGGLDARGVDAWVDWEGIPLSSNWMDEITRAIEGADAFLFVISPDSLASKVCADELALGLKYNKKLVPILFREPEKGASMHEKLAATNWVYMRAQDDFDATLSALVDAISTDLGWVRQHTRLLQRAIEWEQKKRNTGFLLYGTDLDEAEKWMTEATSNPDRHVLPLQAEYIAASRKEALQRQRRTLIGVSLALVVSVFLAILAVVQWNAAVQNERLARANEVLANNNAATAIANEYIAATAQAVAQSNEALARQNEALAKKNETFARSQQKAAEAQLYQARAGALEISTLLAIDSWMNVPTFQAEEIIRQNLSIQPKPIATLRQAGQIWNITLSPDASMFATASAEGAACIWKFADLQNPLCVEHDDGVYDAIFSGDGKQLITGSRDGVVRFWDVSHGTLLQEYDYGYSARIWDLDISPNGRWLAIGREDNLVTVIDLQSARQNTINISQPGQALVVKFSPDSNWLATGVSTGSVRLWRVNTASSVIGPTHTAEVFAIAFSADSREIVSASADSTARLGRVGAGFERLIQRHGDWVEDVAFSPDGSWFVSVSDDNRVWVWDTKTGAERLRMRHANFVQKVRVSPNGYWIATTGYDQTMRIWDSASGSEMMQSSLEGVGSALAFTPDGNRIIVGDRNGNITLWDVSVLAARVGFIQFPEYLQQIQLSPQGDKYFINSDDRLVWQFAADRLPAARFASDGRALFQAESLTYSMDISPDGRWLALAQEEDTNRAILYNLETGKRILIGYAAGVLDVAFSPNSSLMVAAIKSGDLVISDVSTGEFLYALWVESEARSVDFSPDGRYLAVGTQNKTLIFDVETRDAVAALFQVGLIRALAYSPDGRWLVTSSQKGTTLVWDAANMNFDAPVYTLQHNGGMLHLAFSPDMRYLAGGGTDRFAHIWDLSLGEEVARIPHIEQVTGVAFAPDGDLLITASRKVVQLWNLSAIPFVPVSDLIATACAHLTSNLSQVEWETLFGNQPYHPICPNLPVGQN